MRIEPASDNADLFWAKLRVLAIGNNNNNHSDIAVITIP